VSGGTIGKPRSAHHTRGDWVQHTDRDAPLLLASQVLAEATRSRQPFADTEQQQEQEHDNRQQQQQHFFVLKRQPNPNGPSNDKRL
jgi:hypothetical protein